MTELPNGEQDPVVVALRRLDADAIAEVTDFRGELTLVVPTGKLASMAGYLQGEAGLQFDFLSDISVVDRYPIEPRFELNYHLVSLANRRALRMRVRISGADPSIDTVTPEWPTAKWHEREILELFGIRFAGHPDLRRILMPDDWEGYPLRRDYPVEGFR